MKKIFAIVLSIMLTFGLFAGSITVSAEETPSIVLSGYNAVVNETAKLTLTADNFSGVKGMDITVTLPDNAIINSVSATGFSITQDNNYTINGNKLHIVDTLVKKPTDGFSVELNVSFTATGNDKPQIVTQLVDAGKDKIQAVTSVKDIVVIEKVTGDINGDCVCDIRDLVSLKKHLANIPTVVFTANADIDVNETVDSEDLTALIQLLLNKM